MSTIWDCAHGFNLLLTWSTIYPAAPRISVGLDPKSTMSGKYTLLRQLLTVWMPKIWNAREHWRNAIVQYVDGAQVFEALLSKWKSTEPPVSVAKNIWKDVWNVCVFMYIVLCFWRKNINKNFMKMKINLNEHISISYMFKALLEIRRQNQYNQYFTSLQLIRRAYVFQSDKIAIISTMQQRCKYVTTLYFYQWSVIYKRVDHDIFATMDEDFLRMFKLQKIFRVRAYPIRIKFIKVVCLHTGGNGKVLRILIFRYLIFTSLWMFLQK